MANEPIIFTYDDESEASRSSIQYELNRSYNGGGVICTEKRAVEIILTVRTKFSPVQSSWHCSEPFGAFGDGVIPNYSFKVIQNNKQLKKKKNLMVKKRVIAVNSL